MELDLGGEGGPVTFSFLGVPSLSCKQSAVKEYVFDFKNNFRFNKYLWKKERKKRGKRAGGRAEEKAGGREVRKEGRKEKDNAMFLLIPGHCFQSIPSVWNFSVYLS